MSEKVRRVDYNPDEYISGVGGVLTAEQQGVYWMICSLIMSEGEAVDNDPQRFGGLCKMRPSQVRATIDVLVQKGKIKVADDGKLYQKRALNEVEKASKRIRTAAENGAKGGRPAKIVEANQQGPEPTGLSAAKLTTNYQPPTINVEQEQELRPKPQKKRFTYPAAFLQFWEAYPTDSLMSKKEAFTVWDKLPEEEQAQVYQSLPAFKAYCSAHSDYRPVHANRYITQQRYEGFLKTQQATENREFVVLGSETWAAILRKRGVQTMSHSERAGQRGWWFEKGEIAAALKAPKLVEWQTRGAA